MRRLLMSTLLTVVLVGMQTLAFASQWIISQNGEIDVTGQSQVTFDIIYENTDDWFQAGTWDIDLSLDTTELTPHYSPDEPVPPLFEQQYYWVDYVYEDPAGNDFDPLIPGNGELQGNIFTIAGEAFTDVWIAPGQNTMATVTFDILDPDFLSGVVDPDLLVLAQDPVAYKGFTQASFNVIYVDTDSTLNPDIVSAVPVPAAAWLLGSGLFGLIGLRRRNAK